MAVLSKLLANVRVFHWLILCVIFSVAQAEAGTDPRELSKGPPMLTRFAISPKNYVPFETRRLANAWVGWIDYDYFREHGVEIPAGGIQNPEFSRRLLDAFAYQVPSARDRPESFSNETKTFYADYYGGYGTARNRGSARAGSAGRVNSKGIGQTPLLNSTDEYHSNGAAKSIEGMDEAIWGSVLNRELPYGSNRVIAVLFTGTHGFLPPPHEGAAEESFPRALIIREDALRPAHFETNIRIDPQFEPTRLAAIRPYFAQNLPLPNRYVAPSETARIREGFLELVRRRARQFAANTAHRWYNGSSSPSNLQMSGEDLDLGDGTAQPGFAKIFKLQDETPFHDLGSQIEVFEDLLEDLPKTLAADEAAALPALPVVKDLFEGTYRARLSEEMVKLAGFPPEVIADFRDDLRLRSVGEILIELAFAGNDHPVYLDGEAIPNPGRYDFPAVLSALADAGRSGNFEIPIRALVSDAALRSRLVKAYATWYSAAEDAARFHGVKSGTFSSYVAQASRLRNLPQPQLYRGHRRWKELWNVSDAAILRGNRTAVADYIEQTVWATVHAPVRARAAAAPFQLLLGRAVYSAEGISIDRVFDAMDGKNKSLMRIDLRTGRGNFFGHDLSPTVFATAVLEFRLGRADVVSAKGVFREGTIEYVLPTDAIVDASRLRLNAGAVTLLPESALVRRSAPGWQAPADLALQPCRRGLQSGVKTAE